MPINKHQMRVLCSRFQLILWLLLCLEFSADAQKDPVLNYTLLSKWSNWKEVVPDKSVLASNVHSRGRKSTDIVSIPVYVSLTSVSFRIDYLRDVLRTIFDGIVVPSHIFVFLSNDAYLLDKGVQTIPNDLLAMVAQRKITIVFTENIGPHRKLLPILNKYKRKDVLIVNIDDDMAYQSQSTLLYQLLHYYAHSDGNSVVALRSRRVGFCLESLQPPATSSSHPLSGNDSVTFAAYAHWNVHYAQGNKEMFVLPTGTGGVLYRPRFFHPIVFDPGFRAVTGTADDLMFRLACMATGTKVLIACRDLERNGKIWRRCPVEEAFVLNATMHAPTQSHMPESTSRRITLSSSNNISPSKLKHRSATSKRPSLYKLNIAGQNDAQWRNAIRFLEDRRVLNISALYLQHYREREAGCYQYLATDDAAEKNNKRAMSIPIVCSMVRCAPQEGKGESPRRSKKQHLSPRPF